MIQEKHYEYEFISGLSENLKESLEKKYNLDELDIDDVFTDTQLSKLERRKEYLYIAMHFPEFDIQKRKFATKEIHCFVKKNSILIIDKHNYKHALLFNEKRDSYLKENSDGFDVFYEMLDFCVTQTYKVISKFKTEINKLENDIFRFQDNDSVKDLLQELLITKGNIINFISIIYPLQTVIEEIQHKHIRLIDNHEGVEELDDSLDKIKKIVNNLNNFKDQLKLLTETNESLIARNTNQTIKTLTIVNLLFLVPTIITSFFGMNVHFGWNTESGLLPIILILSAIILSTIIAFIVIKKKRLW